MQLADRKTLLAAVLLAAGSLFGMRTALAVPVLDQSHSPTGPNSTSNIGGTVIQAQTFTVGLTGTLVQVDVLGNGGNANLFMDIRGTNGAQPSDTQILETVNAGAFVSGGLTSIPVNVPVTAGDFLSFVFYFQGSGGASLSGAASPTDPYTGGGLWTSGNPPFGGGSWYPNGNSSTSEFDLVFNTIVDVPETSGPFSIVVISDSQFMTEVYPSIFEAQMQWIVDNQVTENIAYVAQLGDLKDDLSCDNKLIAAPVGPARTEWEIVDQTFSLLENATSTQQPTGIPFGVVPGNHDFDFVTSNPTSGGAAGCPNYSTQRPLALYNNDPTTPGNTIPHLGFPPSRFAGRAYYGGSFVAGNNEDNYTLFEAGGVPMIAINLGYRQDASPTSPELVWANDLLQNQFPERLAIVTSHYLMECNAVNPGTGCPSGSPINQLGNYGLDVYGALSGNPNLFMFLSAHRRGESYRIQDRSGLGPGGTDLRPVHMLMSNYQSNNYPTGDPTDPATFSSLPTNDPVTGDVIVNGDSGFMRIMRFDPATATVAIETFSPPMPAAPAVADPDGAGPIRGTPAVAARSILRSVYTPPVSTTSSQANTGFNTGTASNLTIDFSGYVPAVP